MLQSQTMSLTQPYPFTVRSAQALRKRCTEAEIVLWKALRNRQFHGLKFRRQAPRGRFIVDFLCMKPPLIIELDGGIHENQKEEDAHRSQAITEYFKMPILRFQNDEVLNDLPSVLKKIELFLALSPHPGAEAPPLSPCEWRGEPKE